MSVGGREGIEDVARWTRRVRRLSTMAIVCLVGTAVSAWAAWTRGTKLQDVECSDDEVVGLPAGQNIPGYFGCRGVGGHYEHVNVWTEHIMLLWLATAVASALGFVISNWQLSEARYFRRHARWSAGERSG